MAVMMLMPKYFNNELKFISINIIAAISWPPPFFFHPDFLRLHHVFTAWLFLCGFHFFLYFMRPQNQPMADFEVCFTFLLFYVDTVMSIEDRLIDVFHCMIYY